MENAAASEGAGTSSGAENTMCDAFFVESSKVFFDHDTKVSPPIDPGDVAKRGGVVMWRDGGAPGYLKQYSGRLSETIEVTCELAMPRWLRAVAGPTKKVTVKAVFIAPEQ